MIKYNEDGIPISAVSGEPLFTGTGGKKMYLIPGDINNIEPGHSYYISNRNFYSELESYGVTIQDYYDKHYLGIDSPELRPKCPVCGSENYFIGLSTGYSDYCCKSCQVTGAWMNDDGSRREAQRKLGSEIMSELNTWMWDHPDYQEYLKDRNARLSSRMSQVNKQNWKSDEYRKEQTERFIQMMENDPQFKIKGDRANFINHFDFGILYIITRLHDFKLGISNYDVENKDYKSHMWSKLSKWGISESKIMIWHGTAIEVADLEFELKVKYTPIEGYNELFSINQLNSILIDIKNSTLTKVEYD